MRREIFEVYAKIVDANGSYSTLSGYPKVFDSKLLNNDIEVAMNKAYGEYHSTLGAMYPRSDRQVQFVMIVQASTGLQIEAGKVGEIADLPDPE